MTVSSQVKQTLASLKGIEGTLKVYSLKSQNKEEKFVYDNAVKTTAEIIKDLEKRLKILEYEEPQYKGF